MMRRAEAMCQCGLLYATAWRRPVEVEKSGLTERKEEDGISPLTVASPILDIDRIALVL